VSSAQQNGGMSSTVPHCGGKTEENVCNAPMDLFAISVNIFTSILKNKNVMPSHPLGFILRMRMFQRMYVCVCVYV